MKNLKSLALAFIGLFGLLGSAHAEDWWWRHHHHDRVVVGVGVPVIGVGVYAPDYYYRVHHRSLEMDVQAALAHFGYYHGPVDGDIGPGSSAAIRAYQYDNRLPVSGVIDGPLIRSLGL